MLYVSAMVYLWTIKVKSTVTEIYIFLARIYFFKVEIFRLKNFLDPWISNF